MRTPAVDQRHEGQASAEGANRWSHEALYEEVLRLRQEVDRLHAELEARAVPASTIHTSPRRVTRGYLPAVEDRTAQSFGSVGVVAPEPAPFPVRPSGPVFVLPADQGIDFGAVSQLSPEELDALPYGLITLDARGRVLHYNDTESRMVGLPKERVVGKSFFGEVAPCARVREFEGRFEQLVRDPHRVRVQTFDFVFRFANGDQQVTIVLTPARLRGQYNIALLRRGG